MKRALVAVLVMALAVAFTAGTVAWATDKESTIKTIQVTEKVLTLSDGTQLHWTEAVEVPQDLKEGTKVKATYEPKGGKMVLTKIEVIK
jgi:Cu/Ag efflux protein CusF